MGPTEILFLFDLGLIYHQDIVTYHQDSEHFHLTHFYLSDPFEGTGRGFKD